MKLSKRLLQTMTMSLAVGTTVAVTSCTSIKENAEVNPEGEICTITCSENCTDHEGQTTELCLTCGRG